MKRKFLCPLIACILLFDGGIAFSQADTISKKQGGFPLWYFSFGGGFNARGLNFTMDFTITSPGGMGGSVNLTAGYVKLQNVPADYYDGFLRFVTPSDDYTSISCLFLKKFSVPSQSLRMGFAMGPSFVKYNLVRLELNPDYPKLFEYKYNKIHTMENSAGFHAAVITEVTFSNFLAANFNLFADFNSIRNIVGLDFCITAGYVRRK